MFFWYTILLMTQYQQLMHLIKLCSHIYIFAAYSGITSHNLLMLCTKYFDCNFMHIVNPVKYSSQWNVVLCQTGSERYTIATVYRLVDKPSWRLADQLHCRLKDGASTSCRTVCWQLPCCEHIAAGLLIRPCRLQSSDRFEPTDFLKI